MQRIVQQVIHKTKLHKKSLVVLFIALLTVLGILFLSRAWLRTSGATWYSNTFLMPSVDKQFDTDIGYVNEQLALLGVEVDRPDFSDGCYGAQYEGLGVSLACERSAQSGKVYDDEQFVMNWQQKTWEFENDLLSKGWKQNTDQDITKLLDTTLYQPEVAYALDKGKVSCLVRIGFNKYDVENRRVFVDEYCYRPVEIFGGY